MSWWELDTSDLRFSDGGVIERDWESMDLSAMQPYWLTGQFPLSILPRVAQKELDRGRRGDAVLMLLALDPPDTRSPAFLQAYRSDVNGLAIRALREVGVAEMTVEEAWRQVIREETRLIASGCNYERGVGADNLGWMYRKLNLDILREFYDLDYESEDYWDVATRGSIDEARVAAAERLLRVLAQEDGSPA